MACYRPQSGQSAKALGWVGLHFHGQARKRREAASGAADLSGLQPRRRAPVLVKPADLSWNSGRQPGGDYPILKETLLQGSHSLRLADAHGKRGTSLSRNGTPKKRDERVVNQLRAFLLDVMARAFND